MTSSHQLVHGLERISSKSPPIPGARVLLIDDDPIALQTLAENIKEWGCNVVTAESGRQRRVYALTRRGRRALAEQRALWRRFSDAVGGFLEGARPCKTPA